MTDVDFLLARQYELACSARAVLRDYCSTLAPADFTASVPAFAHGSIRQLLVHGAATYDWWLGQVGLGRPAAVPPPTAVPDVAALRQLDAATDQLVADFVAATTDWLAVKPWVLPGRLQPVPLSPLQLFTHAVTHEFHHKGQVLTMSRLLGYEPVDTDVIRTGEPALPG